MIIKKYSSFMIALFCAALFAGCATTSPTKEAIIQQAGAVNLSDGVAKKEAVLLARKYLIENNLDENHRVLDAGHVEYFDIGGEFWAVDFPSRYGFFSKKGYQFTMQVWVDAHAGNIKSAHICKY